jgi:hypothetical protein
MSHVVRCPVIDLRLIFDADEDYANPIEPSAKGGAKIATAILSLVLTLQAAAI